MTNLARAAQHHTVMAEIERASRHDARIGKLAERIFPLLPASRAKLASVKARSNIKCSSCLSVFHSRFPRPAAERRATKTGWRKYRLIGWKCPACNVNFKKNKQQERQNKRDRKEDELLHRIFVHPSISSGEICKNLGLSEETVSKYIKSLRVSGYTIYTVGKSPDYVYELDYE